MLKQAKNKAFGGAAAAIFGWVALVWPTTASELRQFDVVGNDANLRKELLAASLVAETGGDAAATSRAIVAAAQADYGRLLRVLYANGFYGGTVHIRLDGREASEMPTFALPAKIKDVAIRIDPGGAPSGLVAPRSHRCRRKVARQKVFALAPSRAARCFRRQWTAPSKIGATRDMPR